jgi:hypothetical protein
MVREPCITAMDVCEVDGGAMDLPVVRPRINVDLLRHSLIMVRLLHNTITEEVIMVQPITEAVPVSVAGTHLLEDHSNPPTTTIPIMELYST